MCTIAQALLNLSENKRKNGNKQQENGGKGDENKKKKPAAALAVAVATAVASQNQNVRCLREGPLKILPATNNMKQSAFKSTPSNPQCIPFWRIRAIFMV